MTVQRIFLIDGYNVIHRWPRLRVRLAKSLESARDGLVTACAHLQARRHDISRIHVIFDGDPSVPYQGAHNPGGVRVTFSRRKESADDAILSVIKDAGSGTGYVVVSDDGYVKHSARDLEADVMSVAEFVGVVGKQARRVRRHSQVVEHVDKDTLSARDKAAITRSLEKVWE